VNDRSASGREDPRPEAYLSSYLDRLPLSAAERTDILARARSDGGDPRERFAAVHRALAGQAANGADAAHASIGRRLTPPSGDVSIVNDAHGRQRLPTAPALARSSMVPRPWSGGLFARVRKSRDHPTARDAALASAAASPDPQGHWHAVGTFRRVVLLGLVIAQTYIATNFMVAVLPYHGRQPLEIVMLVLFGILFAWVSGGFWTAIAGCVLLLLGGDRFAISRTAPADAPLDNAVRTAIVMPIRNENVPRVFAGLRATYDSLARTGELEQFDFFVLSDSSDPDVRVAELAAWRSMCLAVGFQHVFYRWRRHHIKRKSGNIADFCRRWGRNYRYMVILDADSVMSGECLTRLARLMEANPGAGIIQTAPRAAGRATMYARVQQFANRVYGPLFTAGLHFWQLGESHYWGHNAIIRVRPFMRYCGLRRLPGRGSLSGEILSHDFVEAALMRRAGWAVWIAYDLRGSYEEMPPNLVDELKRDRRWCQGNLMNFRLFMMKGLHVAHRAVFMSGVMAYVSALLWFAFLLLSTVLIAVHTLTVPKYFLKPYQLFPLWPEWHPEWAISLFGATAALLFLPKMLAMLVVALRGARRFGGGLQLVASVIGEMLLSALLAPIRMLFHTRFVALAFLGLKLQWKSPPRQDAETTWRESIMRHGSHTLLGVLWAGGVYWLNPSFLWWLLPVAGALIVSIPVSVYTSRVSLGRQLRRAGLFVIPEELDPPAEIRAAVMTTDRDAATPGFVDAVVDPAVNALICATSAPHARSSQVAGEERRQLIRFALAAGPDALTDVQRMRLIDDPDALTELHTVVWTVTDVHVGWRNALHVARALASAEGNELPLALGVA
jgi:membrane glycosyltransferase